MPRIYVACLASYNNGDLHGAWIDADQDADAIRDAIAAMLRESNHPNVVDSEGRPTAEEWAIHDFEGFAEIKLSEGHDIDEVAALAELIEEHDEELVQAASEVTSENDADSLREVIEDRFHGIHDSAADFAVELFEECGMIPKDLPPIIAGHIDWEGVARDLRLGGDYEFIRVGGSVYVFSGD